MTSQIIHYENRLKYEIDSFDLNEQLANHKNTVVVDTRSKEAFAAEHIPLAINIPHAKMTFESTADLDKSALIITYCDGVGCNASTKGALNMAKLGFKVKELNGGLDWWVRDGYATEGEQGRAGIKPTIHADV